LISKIEALVRNFLRTSADALYLVPGEKIFLMRGAQRTVVGRENLSDESFRGVAGELVPGGPIETLAQMGHKVSYRVDDTLPPVQIQFGRSGASAAMMIRRARASELASMAEPAAVPEVEAPPPEPPPAPATIPLPPPAPLELEAPASLMKPPISATRRVSAPRGQAAKPIDDVLL